MPLDDATLDAQLPNALRLKAWTHFTPAVVARCAAHLLAPVPGTRTLDVGAGFGKFCLVAAEEFPAATFVGVEHRPHLVRIATRLARQLALPNAQFLEGDAFELDWSGYAAFYFYNPFTEQTLQGPLTLDRTRPHDPARYQHDVESTRSRLSVAAVGTRVVTYHGFGAAPPAGYDLIESRASGTDRLELWIKLR